LHPQLLNLDITPSFGVDVVGSASSLPFNCNSLCFVASQEVLEHLPDPEAAVREVYRVLKPGGIFYLQTPFIVGIHDSPHDYWRFTNFGLSALLKRAGFEVGEVRPSGGAGKGMYFVAVEYLASIAGRVSRRLYLPAKGAAAIFAWPLKLFDTLDSRIPVGFYAVARKQVQG